MWPPYNAQLKHHSPCYSYCFEEAPIHMISSPARFQAFVPALIPSFPNSSHGLKQISQHHSQQVGQLLKEYYLQDLWLVGNSDDSRELLKVPRFLSVQ